MKHIGRMIIALVALTWASCLDLSSPGTFSEISRTYSPDSSRYLLKYEYTQGAWDGGRTWSATILRRSDSPLSNNIHFSYTNWDFDRMYWKNKDTVILEGKYTDYIADGESTLKDTVLNGVTIHVVERDPIDSTYHRRIFYQQASPDSAYELYVYKYVKPENGDYPLNISIIKKGDTLPKYGNFYVSRYNFDCFTDIRWDSASALDIKVSESCYNSFTEYLVKHRPDIKYHVVSNDTIGGNIRQYMQ